jgi:branched-chain amino acid aminotransferase
MFVCDWDAEAGWHKPTIVPYQPFSIDPSNSTLHYALEVFEGIKAHPDHSGKEVQIFRPDMNMKRFNRSMNYLAMP